jgi:hypothetical protein
MSKQTAVEWLEQEFIKLESTIGVHGKMYEIIEQAKSMEREQIIEAFDKAYPYDIIGYDAAEQYYNKTYKGGDQ